MNKIIFHYPGPFYKYADSGEKIRPKKMYNAFCELGFDVYEITGTNQERETKLNKVKSYIKEFSFVYSENTTLPLRCSGKFHLPVIKSVDIELFRIAYRNSVPIGVFCRDIYWLYKDFIKEVGIIKYFVSIPFYFEELKVYEKYAKAVFVPSKRFKEELLTVNKEKCIPLPPATDITFIEEKKISVEDKIKLIYVGSIAPSFYDITNFLKVIGKYKNKLELTVVTRKKLWEKFVGYYTVPDNVKVIHISGEELTEEFKKYHISAIYVKPTEYRKLAMPLKLFEAIGVGLPIISFSDCSVSDFIDKNNIGWVVKDEEQDIFEYLINNHNEIIEKTKNVLKVRTVHTWIERAKKVVNELIG